MSVFGKLMFWKKEPGYKDFGEPPGLGPELGLPPAPGDMDIGLPPVPEPSAAPQGLPQLPSETPSSAPSAFEQRQGPMAPPSYAPVPVQQTMPATQQVSSKDIEVVSVKMDNIRQQLDMVNHRLDRIERMLERRY